MSRCRICNSAIEPFLDFGQMPLANGFLSPAEFADECFFNLTAAWCQRCTLVQLAEQPPRERMFNAGYPFFTGSSARMRGHFAALAGEVIAALPHGDPLVVEIGSNDGTLLQNVARAGIRHLGIEPSAGVAAAATAAGVTTISRFFDAALAREIVSAHGRADAIIAANALSHVSGLHDVAEGIDILLAPRGICVIEDPYWGDVVAQTAFDQIYDEHAVYFSVSSMTALFARHGLTVLDAVPFDVHGGSLRYRIGRAKSAAAGARQLLEQERASGLHRPETLTAFRERVMANGAALMTALRGYRAGKKRVVGYGATSKSTTTINLFGITPELIEFISDTTPAKQGRFSPGMHIPVRPPDEFSSRYPDRALLFLWNHAAEVRARERAFTESGGRWLVYVPDVRES